MIQSHLRREYLIACDGCSQPGPTAATPAEADREARRRGWLSLEAFCGFAFLTNWLCPTCQANRGLDDGGGLARLHSAEMLVGPNKQCSINDGGGSQRPFV